MATLETHITERRHLPDRRLNAARFGARGMNLADWAAMVLVIIGGINWGLIGLLNFDLVATLFGEMSNISRAVYAVVGLAALYTIYLCARMAGDART